MKPFHMDEIIQFRIRHPNEYAHLRASIIEECALVIERWENDDAPRSYQDLIDAIRKLKQ